MGLALCWFFTLYLLLRAPLLRLPLPSRRSQPPSRSLPAASLTAF